MEATRLQVKIFLIVYPHQTRLYVQAMATLSVTPHKVTIQKLLTKGVTIYGTITSGTITVSTDGTNITFQDNPQPIPELPLNLIMPIIMVTTLLTVIVYRKKLPHI